MIFTIDNIEGNSGKGQPVFSKPGKYTNTLYKAFQDTLPPREVEEQPESSDPNEWKEKYLKIQENNLRILTKI